MQLNLTFVFAEIRKTIEYLNIKYMHKNMHK